MLTIGKLAKAANIGVETVRYYQRKELIDVPNKTEGFRQYSEEDLRRLKFIKEAQKAGFTLSEIKELLALDTSHDHQRAQELASARIKELDDKIEEMQQARDRLKNLFHQCESGGQNKPCAILKAFEV
ncbi:MerR family transcriptional regulator [Kangiella shandongensis]|uniref:MerR family transcriptional regulator n=1 Tax=Kangiella shandongensis TaxID=2763258 RepID=UPI001CBBD5C0|nr:MerR family transcriptional regulator [Kangiella shandongensis]